MPKKSKSSALRGSKKPEKVRVKKVHLVLKKSVILDTYFTKLQIEKHIYIVNAVNLFGEYHERYDCRSNFEQQALHREA
jgi:hypothetical protein